MQAPKTRRDEQGRRGLLLVLAAAVLALGIAGGAAAWWFLLREDEDEVASVQQVMEAAGCEYQVVAAVPSREHIQDPDSEPDEWNTFPPTSGPHFGQWAIWGEYDDPVRLTEAVHNLEHGGIVIFYGERVPDAEIAELRRFYRDDPVALLLAPLPQLEDEIAVTAWYAPNAERAESPDAGAQGILATCPGFDDDAFRAFRETYRFQGPERIPPDNLQPGM